MPGSRRAVLIGEKPPDGPYADVVTELGTEERDVVVTAWEFGDREVQPVVRELER